MTALRKPYDVDIIVRGRDHFDITQKCLDSITENTPAVPFQILYVDNGSDLGNYLNFLQGYPGIASLRLPYNMGAVRATNLGLQWALLSDAPYTLILDNDAEIPEGDTTWLERFIAYLDDPTIGGAGAVCNRVFGFQNCERQENLFTKDWQEGQTVGYKEPQAVPLLVSYAMLLRKTAIREVGLWDERYEPGNYEDFDYSLQLGAKNWKCIVAASVWIHHRMHTTFSADMGHLLTSNREKFIDKWGAANLQAMGVSV